MHTPHSPQRYVEFFTESLKLRQPLRVGNIHMLMLGSVHPDNPENPEAGLHGEIYRFVKLNTNEPWFNSQTHDVATADEVNEVKIPPYLLPHLQRFPFVFNPKTHHLYYIKKDRSDSMGPISVKHLMDYLITILVDSNQFPEINVTVIPDEKTIDKILDLSTIEHLTIEISRPNPDDGHIDGQRWMEKLERQNAKKVTMTLQSSKGDSIIPDQDTRAMAKVAAMDGKVDVVGRDMDGGKVEESTAKRNMVKYAPVNSDIETAPDVLYQVALDLDATFT